MNNLNKRNLIILIAVGAIVLSLTIFVLVKVFSSGDNKNTGGNDRGEPIYYTELVTDSNGEYVTEIVTDNSGNALTEIVTDNSGNAVTEIVTDKDGNNVTQIVTDSGGKNVTQVVTDKSGSTVTDSGGKTVTEVQTEVVTIYVTQPVTEIVTEIITEYTDEPADTDYTEEPEVTEPEETTYPHYEDAEERIPVWQYAQEIVSEQFSYLYFDYEDASTVYTDKGVKTIDDTVLDEKVKGRLVHLEQPADPENESDIPVDLYLFLYDDQIQLVTSGKVPDNFLSARSVFCTYGETDDYSTFDVTNNRCDIYEETNKSSEIIGSVPALTLIMDSELYGYYQGMLPQDIPNSFAHKTGDDYFYYVEFEGTGGYVDASLIIPYYHLQPNNDSGDLPEETDPEETEPPETEPAETEPEDTEPEEEETEPEEEYTEPDEEYTEPDEEYTEPEEEYTEPETIPEETTLETTPAETAPETDF